ncbi:peptide transporter PTR3-A-like [Hibiscus syriacus]|uniref:Peptide transporter PTR3-A-like n=1 Tax=Hibiscus syriacus TaxID=106335 RepID=A0A6A3AQJ9_HIBSY|nr:peptide transporter PTR3-A-like [Hibiscus syriacus]
MGRQEYFSTSLHHGGSTLTAATTPTPSTSTCTSNDNNNNNNNMDLIWPFGTLENLDHDDIREAAYGIFFMACRSSPGFGGRSALTFYSSQDRQGNRDGGSSYSSHGQGPRDRRISFTEDVNVDAPEGFRHYLHRSCHQRGPPSRPRRPLTSAEIMRQQMKVTEQCDNRLRRTLMRTLVGQVGRRSETIILPLEVLRHLKPSEFNDMHEYHSWQRRQLKILEAGLLNHPSIPIEKSNSLAIHLREIIREQHQAYRHQQELRHDEDVMDDTLVLDEVDELLELMKKAWSTLAINRPIHNVAIDAKKLDREASYVKLLSSMLASMQKWAEKRRRCYNYGRGRKQRDTLLVDSTSDRVDHYIRSSVKNAFAKIIANEHMKNEMKGDREEASEALLQLANETEELAMRERELFSPILKKWHPIAAGVAVGVLHQCYGAVLKQYLAGTSILNGEIIGALQRSSRLEKVLVQMVVEDSEEFDDGVKGMVREMMPYEVDSIIMKLLRQWIDERLKQGRELLCRAKETETWNPKSKSEPYAQSAVKLMNIAEDGSKQSYLPSLPPLTRCSRDSRFSKLWRKANPCIIGTAGVQKFMTSEGQSPRPSTSRGTQRLYIRLNTLHYLSSHLHSLNKTLSLSPRVSTRSRFSRSVVAAHILTLITQHIHPTSLRSHIGSCRLSSHLPGLELCILRNPLRRRCVQLENQTRGSYPKAKPIPPHRHTDGPLTSVGDERSDESIIRSIPHGLLAGERLEPSTGPTTR